MDTLQWAKDSGDVGILQEVITKIEKNATYQMCGHLLEAKRLLAIWSTECMPELGHLRKAMLHGEAAQIRHAITQAAKAKNSERMRWDIKRAKEMLQTQGEEISTVDACALRQNVSSHPTLEDGYLSQQQQQGGYLSAIYHSEETSRQGTEREQTQQRLAIVQRALHGMVHRPQRDDDSSGRLAALLAEQTRVQQIQERLFQASWMKSSPHRGSMPSSADAGAKEQVMTLQLHESHQRNELMVRAAEELYAWKASEATEWKNLFLAFTRNREALVSSESEGRTWIACRWNELAKVYAQHYRQKIYERIED